MTIPHWMIVVGSVLVAQALAFLRWLYRRMRDDDINRAFVSDMATNHLPHIYHALRQMAHKHGIELEEPPPIAFVQFNGSKHKKR